MPNVASDPVVQRPLRPESLSGRAGAPAGEPSGSFEGLLDAAPAAQPPAPPTARPERATRTRSADRSDQARAAGDRNPPQTSTRPSRSADAAPTKTSTKPADSPNTRQAKNGQPSDASQPAASAPDAAPEIAPVPAEVLVAIAEAVTAETSGDAKPVAANTDTVAATPDQAPDGGDEPNVAVAADATTIDVAAVAIVAVALPVPAAVNPLPAPVPTVDPSGIAPIEAPGSAPVAPADAAPTDAPVQPAATPATTDADGAISTPTQAAAEPATPESAGKSAAPDESQKAAALKPESLPETPETKSTAPADQKAEPGKTKSVQTGNLAHTSNAHAAPDAAPPADAPAEQQSKAPGPRQPHTQPAEHATLAARSAPGEPRGETSAARTVAAQVNTAAPLLPFNPAATAPMPLAGVWPVTALRVDPGADSAVPVAGLAVEIVSRAQDGLRRFDIRLDPPELGRIDVRLDVDTGGKVTSRLVVERAETLDLLRRDAPQLERALQHAGLNTEGGLEFSLRDQAFANRDQTPRDVPATRLIVPADEPAATEAARRGYGRMIGLGGGIDIRV